MANLAYDYDEQIYKGWEEVERQREIHKRKKEERIRRRNRQFFVKLIFFCIMIFTSSVFMISRIIEYDNTEKRISLLEDQLKEAEAYTAQKTFELEQSVDLAKIEEIATTKFGMQRAEKYQIVYLNMKKEDKTDVTAKEVEGITNNIYKKSEYVKDNVKGIFKFGK